MCELCFIQVTNLIGQLLGSNRPPMWILYMLMQSASGCHGRLGDFVYLFHSCLAYIFLPDGSLLFTNFLMEYKQMSLFQHAYMGVAWAFYIIKVKAIRHHGCFVSWVIEWNKCCHGRPEVFYSISFLPCLHLP